MRKRPPLWRRRFLVNEFQIALQGFLFLYMTAIAGVLYAAGVVRLLQDLNDRGLSSRERGESAQVLLHLHDTVLPWILPVVLVIAIHFVLVSHRIAGPIYRFTRILTEIGAGDLTAVVRLRRKDHLKHEAAVLNDMIESLNAKVRSAQEGCRSVAGIERELERAIATEDTESVEAVAYRLRDRVARLEASLATFRTRTPTTLLTAASAAAWEAASASRDEPADETEGRPAA